MVALLLLAFIRSPFNTPRRLAAFICPANFSCIAKGISDFQNAYCLR